MEPEEQKKTEPQTSETRNESPTNTSDEANTQSDSTANTSNKISLLLMPAPGTPILRKKNFKVDPAYTIGQLSQLLRTLLKLDNSESLFIYVNQIFAPALDQCCRNLFSCFGCDGKLILTYSKSPMWG